MELEDVFHYFLPKFEALPKGPRSVAEARITADELEALTCWLCERWEFSMWCEGIWQVEKVSASPQEMCGGLLLIFASEACRDRSNEDSVWPAVTAVLRANKGSFPTLFVGGQPTSVCKNAVVAGTRRLSLRNLIDRYGTQEYFDTLKLQFGFTLKGAIRRLPEWLDGLGLPIAVKILSGAESEYGDLRSSSFADLWKTLYDFRRSRASQDYASAILQTSPWIRSDWTGDLLKAAKLRTARTFNAAAITGTVDPSSEPVCEPILRWEYSSLPQLFLRINEERIDATQKLPDFGGINGLMAAYYEAGAGELLLRNAGGEAWSKDGPGFAVCTRCGFATSEEKPFDAKGAAPALPKTFKNHPSVFSPNPNSRCWPQNIQYEPVLRHKVLAARETTDVLILNWPGDSGEGSLFSLGRALLLAGARLLELDSRELGLELKPRGTGELSILLYDTVPGGAGHSFELMKLGKLWLKEARNILCGSSSHDEVCRRACLECLLDFGGQFKAHLLDRKGALELLDGAISFA